MTEAPFYDEAEPVHGVERIFQSCEIRFQRGRHCFEAREVLRGPAAPGVVVTDLALPDGDWTGMGSSASPNLKNDQGSGTGVGE